ncbi:DUF5711 family protein [uncultured Agathobaculum sp.]|uniref:DUF5711 family protein n=1 Tax=uncultured Agathobaculum sp. TaxID=2048140 RepID=UPI00296FD73E
MGDQNNPSPGQNVIRFPVSQKERRQRMRESRDPRIRTTALLGMLCGWALVAGTLAFLLVNYRAWTPTSLHTIANYIVAGARSHDGDITTINYENETCDDGALFESGLAYADSDALFLSRAGSMTTLKYSLGYSDPAVESCDRYVLVYDRGGIKAALVNSAAATAELELESTILNGSIGRDGHFVLTTGEHGYRSAAAVYDTAGKEVFKYRSSEYYMVTAVLSPDCKTLAALGFRQNGITLESHVLFFDVSSGKQYADAVLSDSLGVALTYSENGAAAVLCDNGLFRVTRKGDTEQLLELSAQDLVASTTQPDRMALAIRSYQNGARCDLYTVRGGTLHGPFALAEEPSTLAISNAGTAVLSAAGVSVYSTAGQPQWHNTDAVGAHRVLMTDDGTVFLLYNKNARIFTAHSTQSEELYPDEQYQ